MKVLEATVLAPAAFASLGYHRVPFACGVRQSRGASHLARIECRQLESAGELAL